MVCFEIRNKLKGDRFLTDVVFGNQLGALTCKTDFLTLSGERHIVKQVTWCKGMNSVAYHR